MAQPESVAFDALNSGKVDAILEDWGGAPKKVDLAPYAAEGHGALDAQLEAAHKLKALRRDLARVRQEAHDGHRPAAAARARTRGGTWAAT